jgi:hypothetical protein
MVIELKTVIKVRYTLNPNFEPSENNIAEVKCTKITYCYPQIAMLPPGHVNTEPMRYSLFDEESGKCVEIAGYQLIDVTYESGWEERMEAFRTTQIEMSQKLQDEMKEGLEQKTQQNNELPKEGIEYHV